jgi:hypothetical protein
MKIFPAQAAAGTNLATFLASAKGTLELELNGFQIWIGLFVNNNPHEYMRTGSYGFPPPSKAEIMYQYKVNVKPKCFF